MLGGSGVDGEPPGSGLRLYITGRTVRSERAVECVRQLAERYLDAAEVETVDVLQHPEKAEEDAVVATPMLVRRTSGRGRRVVGDLAAIDEVATWLELEAGAK